jgi:hypothetical protein
VASPVFFETRNLKMTTTVTVKANHGWAVKVLACNPVTGDVEHTSYVPAGEQQDFVVFATRDLVIHEMQPGEALPDVAA